jgi:hypothetical protein
MPRKIIAAFICFSYTHAAVAQLYDNSKGQSLPQGNEFFVGREYGKPLVKVNLISGVQRPGVYHVPAGSDLAEVIAYAGGASEKAKLNDITIVRQKGTERSSLEVNLEKSLTRPSLLPSVADQDIVHIPVDKSLERTMTWVSILSGLASVALAVTVIDQNNKN